MITMSAALTIVAQIDRQAIVEAIPITEAEVTPTIEVEDTQIIAVEIILVETRMVIGETTIAGHQIIIEAAEVLLSQAE
jgi:hypothetical protein